MDWMWLKAGKGMRVKQGMDLIEPAAYIQSSEIRLVRSFMKFVPAVV